MQASRVLDNQRAKALLVGLAQVRALEHIVLMLGVVSGNVGGGVWRVLSQDTGRGEAGAVLDHRGRRVLGHLVGSVGEGLPHLVGRGVVVRGAGEEPGI